MTVKTTGAEWRRFYTDPAFWPNGAWHDDEEITVDGNALPDDFDLLNPPDAARLTVSGGIVFVKENDNDGPSLEAHFRRWRKAQATVTLSVEAPKDLVDAIRAAVVEAGGKVLA